MRDPVLIYNQGQRPTGDMSEVTQLLNGRDVFEIWGLPLS